MGALLTGYGAHVVEKLPHIPSAPHVRVRVVPAAQPALVFSVVPGSHAFWLAHQPGDQV